MQLFICPQCGHESSYDPWKASARCANCGYTPRPGDHRRRALRVGQAADDVGEAANRSKDLPALESRRWVVALFVSIVLVTPLVALFYWVLQQAAPHAPIPLWIHALVWPGFALLANGLRLVQARKGVATVSPFLAGALGKGGGTVTDLGRSRIGRRLLLEGRAALALGALRAFAGVGLILAAYALRVL